MSNIEALRLQVDNLQLELQQLKVENTKLRAENTTVASEIDAENRLHAEVENANKEVMELRQRLHEAQEGQALCEDKLASLSTEYKQCCEKNHELEEHILRLNDELLCANQVWEGKIKQMQMEAELQRYHSLEEQRKNHELKESHLVELLGALRGNTQQVGSASSNHSIEPQATVSSSHVEPRKSLSSNEGETSLTCVNLDRVSSRSSVVVVSPTSVGVDGVSSGSSRTVVSLPQQRVSSAVNSSGSACYTQSGMNLSAIPYTPPVTWLSSATPVLTHGLPSAPAVSLPQVLLVCHKSVPLWYPVVLKHSKTVCHNSRHQH